MINGPRARGGKGEQCPRVRKEDLAGGQRPSGDVGENAAGWAIRGLAFHLNALLKPRGLPESWAGQRLQARRFAFLQLAGRGLDHARQLIVCLASRHRCAERWFKARQRIWALAQAPPG